MKTVTAAGYSAEDWLREARSQLHSATPEQPAPRPEPMRPDDHRSVEDWLKSVVDAADRRRGAADPSGKAAGYLAGSQQAGRPSNDPGPRGSSRGETRTRVPPPDAAGPGKQPPDNPVAGSARVESPVGPAARKTGSVGEKNS
ncbi:MAG: hypothetical protein AB1758_15895, partial [Candidatus Eremiobacterota bacterium]